MAYVLIIDDDPDIRQALALILESEGYEVSTASDGLSGLELLRVRLPDAVILDLMMPRMSGWELREVLERDPLLARIPQIVISAAALNQAIVGGDFLPKPFEPSHLLRLLARRVTPNGRPGDERVSQVCARREPPARTGRSSTVT
jgi:CheY-like chemotaxis protein